MEYEAISDFSDTEIELALIGNDLTQLRLMPICISLSSTDLIRAEQICMTLSTHSDHTVRGNAILGFGHLARRFGKLTQEHILSVIETALIDKNSFERGRADAAADDVEHFLKWKLKRAIS